MADENPILNNPYEEPEGHYATNLAGELDYSKPVKGRRVFTPEIQTIPVRQGAQEELMELNEVAGAQYGGHAVNLLRREVPGVWKDRAAYEREPGQPTEDYELPPRRADPKPRGKNPLEG
jgi:type III restriction enzyme